MNVDLWVLSLRPGTLNLEAWEVGSGVLYLGVDCFIFGVGFLIWGFDEIVVFGIWDIGGFGNRRT